MFKVIEEKIAIPLLIILALFVLGGIFWSVRETDKDFDTATQYSPVIKNDNEFNDWKTYRNEEFGFEFKYPEEFGSPNEKVFEKTSPDRDGLILSFPDTEINSIRVEVNPPGVGTMCTFEKFIGYSIVNQNNSFELTDRREDIPEISGCPNDLDGATIISARHIPTSMSISLRFDTRVAEEQEREQFFKQILSTFKFIE